MRERTVSKIVGACVGADRPRRRESHVAEAVQDAGAIETTARTAVWVDTTLVRRGGMLRLHSREAIQLVSNGRMIYAS